MSVTATCYLQIEGEVIGSGTFVKAAKVVAYTQAPPGRPKPGTICIRVNLKIPEGAFLRLIPEADVEIPEEWWTTTPVVVVSEPPVMEVLEGQ